MISCEADSYHLTASLQGLKAVAPIQWQMLPGVCGAACQIRQLSMNKTALNAGSLHYVDGITWV